MKTYKHDTEPMINTRAVFREEMKSTPVQDVTTSSAQIDLIILNSGAQALINSEQGTV